MRVLVLDDHRLFLDGVGALQQRAHAVEEQPVVVEHKHAHGAF